VTGPEFDQDRLLEFRGVFPGVAEKILKDVAQQPRVGFGGKPRGDGKFDLALWFQFLEGAGDGGGHGA